jgi:hypothetical protein
MIPLHGRPIQAGIDERENIAICPTKGVRTAISAFSLISFKSPLIPREQPSESAPPLGSWTDFHFLGGTAMWKKLIGIAVLGTIGIYVVGETKAGSHVRAWFDRVGTKLESQVRPETELARIKHEIGELDGDVDRVKGDLAEANVNVRLLRRDVEESRKDVKESETAVRKHAEVIKTAGPDNQILWGARRVSSATAKDMLQAEVNRHNSLKAQLRAREQALATQEQTRDLVEQQLQEMLKQKEELASSVAELDADIKLANVEQIRSKYQNDGTRMGNIKTSLADLRKQVMVQREKLRVTETYVKTPAAEKSVDEILQGIEGAVKSTASNVAEVKVVTPD